MNILVNPITTHKNARWFALCGLFLGQALILAGYTIPAKWSIYVMIAGLAVWYVPIAWCAYRWAGGK